MTNHGRNRRTGQFISRRVQNVQQLADLPDREWDLDDEAMGILEAGIAKALQDGWVPPAVWTIPEPDPGWDEAPAQDVGTAPDQHPDDGSWIDALKDGGP